MKFESTPRIAITHAHLWPATIFYPIHFIRMNSTKSRTTTRGTTTTQQIKSIQIQITIADKKNTSKLFA